MNVWVAKFPGSCPVCLLPWQQGDLIVPSDVPNRAWQHNVCPEAPDPLPGLRRGEISCPVCFLIHPIGACDR